MAVSGAVSSIGVSPDTNADAGRALAPTRLGAPHLAILPTALRGEGKAPGERH
jgi:hypothetical protein